MTPRKIKARMKEKNIRQADLARRWGVARCTVHALIHGKFKSKSLERRLSRVLGTPSPGNGNGAAQRKI